MSIFINEKTPVLVQGLTGRMGSFHAQEMIEYGTNVVAGVTPGKGGTTHLGKPVFNTVKEAVAATGAEASIVFVPPAYAADGIMEAAESGIKYCVSITDGIPTHDMIRVKRYLFARAKPEDRMILTGPNCAGTISPGKAMLGIMPGHIYMQGNVGLIGRSGTLGYEAASQMKELGIGISTGVGIGGDPIIGTPTKDAVELLMNDPETDGIIMIGEIGGSMEAEAAEWIKANKTKPVVGFIAGQTAPPGRRMGHAGAIVGGADDTAAAKMKIMAACGIHVVASPADIGKTMAEVINK